MRQTDKKRKAESRLIQIERVRKERKCEGGAKANRERERGREREKERDRDEQEYKERRKE